MIAFARDARSAVAGALRLDETERTHLFELAKPKSTHTRRRPMPPQRVRAGLYHLLDILPDTPAIIVGCRMDVLATNRLARALYTDFDAMPRRERNVARYVFLDKGARELFVDWEIAARETVAALHLYAGRHPHDPQFADLIGDLSVRDEDFRHWWDAHDVDQHTHGTKQYRHALVGDLTLEYESLTFPDDPDQTLILSIAKPESPSAHALGLLASWTNTPGGPTRPAPGNPPHP